MKVLVTGYEPAELSRICDILAGAGHNVLEASGKHGAQAFVRAVKVDCLMAPGGDAGRKVRIWLAGLTDGLAWVEVRPGGDPLIPLEAFDVTEADDAEPLDLARLDEAVSEAITGVEDVPAVADDLPEEPAPRRVAPLSRPPLGHAPGEDLVSTMLESDRWPEDDEAPLEPGAPTVRTPLAPGSDELAIAEEMDGVDLATGPAAGPLTRKDTSPPHKKDTDRSVTARLSAERSKHTEPPQSQAPKQPPQTSLDKAGARPATSPGGTPFTTPWGGRRVSATEPPEAVIQVQAPPAREAISPLPSPAAPSRPVTAQVVLEPPVRPGPAEPSEAPGPPRTTGSAPRPSDSRALAAPIERGTAAISHPIPNDSHHPDIVSKLAQSRFGDYHSLLEIELEASPFVVREQFQRLSERYSPSGWAEKLSSEELEMLLEVGSSLRDAYLVLSDAEFRGRYERALANVPTARS